MPAINANEIVDVTGAPFELPVGTLYLEIGGDCLSDTLLPQIVQVQNASLKAFEVIPCILDVQGAGVTDWEVHGDEGLTPLTVWAIAWTTPRPWARVSPFSSMVQTAKANSSLAGS